MPSHFLLEKLINPGSHHLGAEGGMQMWVDQFSTADWCGNTEWSLGQEQLITTMYKYINTSEVFLLFLRT